MMRKKVIYYCNDCKRNFTGFLGISRCPFCDGENVIIKDETLKNKMMEVENGRNNMSELQVKIKAY